MTSQEATSVQGRTLRPPDVPEAEAAPGAPTALTPARGTEFALERYKFILEQIHTVNENLYRFLAIYQTLATTLAGGALALFVGYRRWGVAASTARGGVLGLLALATVVAGFTTILIVVGAIAWLDYRREECELTDEVVRPGFRARPRTGNVFRWYELYVLIFIWVSIAAMWLLAGLLILPAMT
jgi:hypothetical protein